MAVIGKAKRRALAVKKRAATLRATGRGKKRTKAGIAHGGAELTVLEVQTMRALAKRDGWTAQQLSEHYGIPLGYVHQILSRTVWKNV
jgi:hypothetical protein